MAPWVKPSLPSVGPPSPPTSKYAGGRKMEAKKSMLSNQLITFSPYFIRKTETEDHNNRPANWKRKKTQNKTNNHSINESSTKSTKNKALALREKKCFAPSPLPSFAAACKQRQQQQRLRQRQQQRQQQTHRSKLWWSRCDRSTNNWESRQSIFIFSHWPKNDKL